jgi:hypothetical protein
VRRPNLFIVGAPKCGTSSLHNYLGQHPEIFMTQTTKEPAFFCPELRVNEYRRPRSEGAYLKLFAGARDEKYLGESTTWHLYSREAAQRIRQYDGEARIIIMLRSPVEAMYSLHGQFIFSCNEDILDFSAALEAEADRRQGRRLPSTATSPDGLQYTRVFTYTEQVRRYFDAFGREQVRVIIFDDFIRDTPGEYRKTLEFLGVDPTFQAALEVVNAAKPVALGINRFLARRPRLRSAIHCLVPASVQRKVIDTLPQFASTIDRPTKLDPELKRRLQPMFRQDIEQLSQLLGRDLTHWCKPPGS